MGGGDGGGFGGGGGIFLNPKCRSVVFPWRACVILFLSLGERKANVEDLINFIILGVMFW